MWVDMPRQAIVIRFAPMSSEGLRRSAETALRLSGRHDLSVWADVRGRGEREEDACDRLLSDSGFLPENNRNFWVCIAASALLDNGFTFWKDGYSGEPERHYSVDISAPGRILVPEALEAFRAVFEKRRWR